MARRRRRQNRQDLERQRHPPLRHPQHTSTVLDIAWRPDADELAAIAYGAVTFWSPTTCSLIRQFDWKGSSLVLAWSPDGKYLATGDQDATVHFWMIATGVDLCMSGYYRKVRELAWDPSARFLATGGSVEICIWDCSGNGPEGTTPLILKAHQEPLTALAYQHRGSLLASGDEVGELLIWRPATSKRPRHGFRFNEPITRLAWSPQDNALAVADADGNLRLFHNLAT